MSEYQEFTGKSVEEALRNAREAFGVAGLEDLDFEILTQGSRGVLGMGAEPARIIAAPRSALGGVAPKREAAAAAPPPPPPPASGGAGAPREGGAPREAGPPREARPRDARQGRESGGESRGPASRHERGGDRRRERGGQSREATRVGGAASAEVAAAVAASPTSRREPVEEVETSPEALAAGRELLEHLVGLMDYEARVEVSAAPSPRITVYGADDEEKEALGALIGRKGERLSALQHLVNLMLSRKMGTWTRVLVDVEDYRGRRERQLIEVATRAAEHVRESGQMLQLEPMSALERRWVHLALRDMEGITTQSIGEEPMRRVVILRI
jgi:spoIIIJ-associated protein